jgi:NAD-dependent dihydropyrimidine dehydrogenase PreA subunit
MWILTIDSSKCEGDGDCVEVCPLHMLSVNEANGKKIAMMSGNPEDCAYCFACVQACSTESIEILEAEKSA